MPLSGMGATTMETGGDQCPSTFWTLGPPIGWFPPTFDNEHKQIKLKVGDDAPPPSHPFSPHCYMYELFSRKVLQPVEVVERCCSLRQFRESNVQLICWTSQTYENIITLCDDATRNSLLSFSSAYSSLFRFRQLEDRLSGLGIPILWLTNSHCVAV